MRFHHHDVDQRSPEWLALRLGRLTSSTANDMLAQGRGNTEAASRKKLRIRLALERITGRSGESDYVSAAMQAGIEREADALSFYEARSGNLVQRCGFLSHPELMAGASLDGYIGTLDRVEGIVEAKSPEAHTHLEYLRTGKVPTDYLRQVTHQLWITGAEWCDWFSYQPQFPEALQCKVVRVWSSDVDLAAYELALRLFLNEVEAEVSAIQALAAA